MLAPARYSYEAISKSHNSFRVTTNEGVDADDSEDGMIPRTKEIEYTINGSEISWGKNGIFKTTLVSNKFSAYGVVCTKSGERITWDGGSCNIDGGKFTVTYDKWLPDPNSISDLNHRVFQGFKYGDLPTTYVIGDGVAYAQRQQDTAVDFSDIVDLDKMYPESEYYLNDRMRKWVRKIRRTVLNRQILPVYTSMEDMDKDVHSLTVDEMKSITFQVVPSFYWKYDWSYNEFMIHRVGKLKAPSKELEMYDMLGNVWEWVRDDWSPDIKALSGNVNPIVGNKDNDHNTKKVIKGGSFDQLLRKVVSAVREDLARNESRSKYATQSNVGFRPSLTFTAENEGGVFVPGETPVDLFFLFDASASQDTEMQIMLQSALKIVDMFSSSDSEKDVCHVGSALFLGNNVRLMCSNQVDTIEQSLWAERYNYYNNWTEGHAPRGFVP